MTNDEEGNKPYDEPANLDGFAVNVGYILKASIADCRQLEKFMKTLPNTKLLFVKRSQGRLWIVPISGD